MTSLVGQQGSLSGKITDDLYLSMPGASVLLNTQPITGTIADNKGNYTIMGIPPGNYIVTVSYLGYQEKTQEIVINAGITTFLDIVMSEASLVGDEVIILGDRLRGQAKALNQQKYNINVTNIVAADQIGRFPDANVGDAMKRIPGITMQNDQGEARDIIIRGMDPELNSVSINGERMPSAEGDNRRLQMDLIPADMIQTIEVNKAVLPNMDADAIGGSVNLITRQAPEGYRVSGTLASGLNFLSKKPIYTGGLVLSTRTLNNKLGMILSGSYNNHNFGSDNYEARWVETDNPDYPVVMDRFDLRKYDVQRVRRSVSLALDYEIAPNHEIAFNGMYNWRDDWENRYRLRIDRLERDVDDGGMPTSRFQEFEKNLYRVRGRAAIQTKGGIDNDRTKGKRLEDQRLANYTLSGKHLFNNLRMTWSGTYARASEDRPGERYISHRGNAMVNVDTRDPFKALVTFVNPDDELGLPLSDLYEQNNFTFEEDFNARLDFSYPISDKGSIEFGGRLRSKVKERIDAFDAYEAINGLTPAGDDFGNLPNSAQNERLFLNGPQYAPGRFVTKEFLGGLDFSNSSLFEGSDLLEEYITSNYTSNEVITAAFVMADYKLTDKLTALAGLRLENTSLKYQGFEFDTETETANQSPQEEQNYANFMPGLHLKYNFSNYSILRFAWTNTLARPNYFDLVPYAIYDPSDQDLARGNPTLQPTTAMNFDLLYENYFQTVGLISGGLFYKDISNFIYGRSFQNFQDPQFGLVNTFVRPENGGTADVYGMEVSAQRQMDFLPGFWKGFGIYINYTFTESSTTGIAGRENDDLRLPGTARNMFNASLSYETKKLVIRTSLNYASDYIDAIAGSAFADEYYDRQTFLDVNLSYAVTPKWRIFAEANNLTNQPLRYYQGIRERTQQEEFYNVRVNAALKFDIFRKR
jgi:TonB-dependent receptor